MSSRRGFWVSLVAVLLLVPTTGCGGDDDDDEKGKENGKPVEGTFVGRVPETSAFVSVVASRAPRGQERRPVTVFVCDAERICEWFPGSATGNSFTIKSNEAEAKGELTKDAAKGTIELAEGEPLRYDARPAPATAGLYNLTVSSTGRIRGASEAGVALKGDSPLPNPGSGSLRLADRKRVKFEVTSRSGDDLGLRAGQVRVIILPDRQLRGAGKNRDGDESNFFIRSSK